MPTNRSGTRKKTKKGLRKTADGNDKAMRARVVPLPKRQEAEPAPSGQRYSVPALVRAFQVIDMLAMSSVGLTKMEIASKLKLPYSSVFNILATMEHHGYVRQDPPGKFHLGLKLLGLGSIPNRDLGLRDAVAPLLEQLVRETGLTGHLAILDRGEAVYIDKKEAGGFIKINSWIGKRNYVHSSAVGKVLIAYQPKCALEELLTQEFPKRTPKTTNNIKKLKEELNRVRRYGYAIDDEEDELGGRCVAGPVLDASGAVVAAMGLSGVTQQIPDSRLPELGEAIRKYAGRASARLGYQGPSKPV